MACLRRENDKSRARPRSRSFSPMSPIRCASCGLKPASIRRMVIFLLTVFGLVMRGGGGGAIAASFTYCCEHPSSAVHSRSPFPRCLGVLRMQRATNEHPQVMLKTKQGEDRVRTGRGKKNAVFFHQLASITKPKVVVKIARVSHKNSCFTTIATTIHH